MILFLNVIPTIRQIYNYDLIGDLFKDVAHSYRATHGHPTVLKSVFNELLMNRRSL